MRRAGFGVAVLALLVAATAVTLGRRGRDPAPAPPFDALGRALAADGLSRIEAQGRRLFVASCATCHGASGRGDGQNAFLLTPPPPDFSTSLAGLDREARRRVIQHGSAVLGRSALCPPHGAAFSAEEVEAVLVYLDRLARQGPPPETTRRRRRG